MVLEEVIKRNYTSRLSDFTVSNLRRRRIKFKVIKMNEGQRDDQTHVT